MTDYELSSQESGEQPRPAHRNDLAATADEKTLKRARWEHLRLAACPGAGRVNVANYSYGVAAVRTGEHTHTVTVERGEPTACTCAAAKYHSGPCKHALAVADAPDVIAEAMRGGDPSTDPNGARRVVTDGGRVQEPTCDRCGAESERFTPVHETTWSAEYDHVCGPCLLSEDVDPFASSEDDNTHEPRGGTEENTVLDDHGDPVPRRSERADFGGGESTGVQDL